jgi:hypothetical protein
MHRSDDRRYQKAEYEADAYQRRGYLDLRDGGVAGIVGGGAIMLFFLTRDLLIFTPLATPEALSDGLLSREGLAARIDARLRVLRILLFSLIHLGIFAVLGIVLAKLPRVIRFWNALLMGGLYGLIGCSALFFLGMEVSGTGLSVGLSVPSVVFANLLAGIVMAAYLRLARSL